MVRVFVNTNIYIYFTKTKTTLCIGLSPSHSLSESAAMEFFEHGSFFQLLVIHKDEHFIGFVH